MKGTWRSYTKGVCWKTPLSVQDPQSVWEQIADSSTFNDLLFKCQLSMGFLGLLCLGEIVGNDKLVLQDWRRITMRHSLQWLPSAYSFWLPYHKGGIVFGGNQILYRKITGMPDPIPIMHQYLDAQDQCFPLHPQLWLWANGTEPLWMW